ncbi:hypothetical protein GX48_00995 [Paracoccidioides brasiliensis]|nr:hypothetical protein GX48_00995 [Paracoccidioides brasiliensis]
MWPSHLDSSSSKQREQNSVHDFPSSVHPLFRLPPPGHSFIVPLISVLLSIGWIVKQQAKHDTSKSEAYFNAEPTPLKSISHGRLSFLKKVLSKTANCCWKCRNPGLNVRISELFSNNSSIHGSSAFHACSMHPMQLVGQPSLAKINDIPGSGSSASPESKKS